MSRVSRVLAAVAATAVAVGLLVAVSSPAPAATKQATARHASGFRIGASRLAPGSWIGSYRVGSHLAYRYQPGRAAGSGPYRTKTFELPGRSKIDQQAAWILANFGKCCQFPSSNGGRPSASVQSASVDAAVYTLLARGKWSYDKPAGAARVRQTHRSEVRRGVRTLLRLAKKYAGAWSSRVSVPAGTPAGTSATVTFSAKNTRTGGKLFPGTVIKFSYAGTSKTAKTGSDGTASASFVAQPGGTRVAAWVAKVPFGDLVPAWRLYALKPVKRSLSAMVIADKRSDLRASAPYGDTSAQSLTISPRSTRPVTPAKSSGTWKLVGSTGASQTATYTFFGPSSNARCSGPGATVGSATVAANRTYSLPAMALSKAGYYSWRISLSGDSSGDSAYQSRCSSTFLVRSATHLKQYGPSTASIPNAVTLSVTVRGFTTTERHRLTGRLYGPFATSRKVKCSGKPFRTQSDSVSGNGTYGFSTKIRKRGQAGWYAWRSTLSNTTLTKGSTSSCGAKVHVTR